MMIITFYLLSSIINFLNYSKIHEIESLIFNYCIRFDGTLVSLLYTEKYFLGFFFWESIFTVCKLGETSNFLWSLCLQKEKNLRNCTKQSKWQFSDYIHTSYQRLSSQTTIGQKFFRNISSNKRVINAFHSILLYTL